MTFHLILLLSLVVVAFCQTNTTPPNQTVAVLSPAPSPQPNQTVAVLTPAAVPSPQPNQTVSLTPAIIISPEPQPQPPQPSASATVVILPPAPVPSPSANQTVAVLTPASVPAPQPNQTVVLTPAVIVSPQPQPPQPVSVTPAIIISPEPQPPQPSANETVVIVSPAPSSQPSPNETVAVITPAPAQATQTAQVSQQGAPFDLLPKDIKKLNTNFNGVLKVQGRSFNVTNGSINYQINQDGEKYHDTLRFGASQNNLVVQRYAFSLANESAVDWYIVLPGSCIHIQFDSSRAHCSNWTNLNPQSYMLSCQVSFSNQSSSNATKDKYNMTNLQRDVFVTSHIVRLDQNKGLKWMQLTLTDINKNTFVNGTFTVTQQNSTQLSDTDFAYPKSCPRKPTYDSSTKPSCNSSGPSGFDLLQ